MAGIEDAWKDKAVSIASIGLFAAPWLLVFFPRASLSPQVYAIRLFYMFACTAYIMFLSYGWSNKMNIRCAVYSVPLILYVMYEWSVFGPLLVNNLWFR